MSALQTDLTLMRGITLIICNNNSNINHHERINNNFNDKNNEIG